MNKLNDKVNLLDRPFGMPFSDEVLSVSKFNSLIKDVLKSLGVFRIKGEVTEFNITRNQGVNITLSDGKANLRIGGYAPNVKGIDLIEKDMDVVVIGVADLYVPYGSFSLSALAIEPIGEGSLAIAYQKLKEKLEEEGLFALEHKQELPRFITRVALLTGEDSAAYSDFIKILKENNTCVEILYYPVLVQGKQSVKNISDALIEARNTNVDLIVLTRGGGSLEDLKSFNDEELARLIFSSPKPIIAGVGHEKDESIADFVADIRASTPSQAAYYIVEQNNKFVDFLVEQGDEIDEFMKELLRERQRSMESVVVPLEEGIQRLFLNLRNNLKSLERILSSYNISNTLARGFSILTKQDRRILSVKDVNVDDEVNALLTDGALDAKINKISERIKYGKTKGSKN
ncbi:exodeoxyribonuclease VII large subunit [Candidatus Dojkabacteria bacterium]|nr:exodeoxyribonuclease VII large subunit [Candidatus Dojkabacteria bacterium]